jgi:hypothetical protein
MLSCFTCGVDPADEKEVNAAETMDGVASEHPAVKAWRRGRLGLGFSGAGFLLPYFLGAYECLEAMGIVNRDTPMAGASSGSLVVASVKVGLTLEKQMESFLEVAADCRKLGVKARLRSALKAQLIR